MFFGTSLKPGSRVDVAKSAPCKGVLLLTNVCLTSGDKAGLYLHRGDQVHAVTHLSSESPHARLSLRIDTEEEPCALEARQGAVDVLGFVEDPREGTEAIEAKTPEKAQEEVKASKDATPAKQSGKEAPPKNGNANTKKDAIKDAPAKTAATKDAPQKAATPEEKKQQQVAAPKEDFIPSKRWNGPAPGMVFKKGPKGLGYYRDTPPKVGGTKRKAEEPASGQPARKMGTLQGGLKFEVLKAGGGNAPQASRGRSVQVRYEGRLTNGKRFDKGTIRFRLGAGEVIKGWDLGVNGMKVGERRKLLIPPQLAYGPRGAPPDIPPNATLAFDVELLKTT